MKLGTVSLLVIGVISLALAESQGLQVDDLEKTQDILASNLKKDLVAEIERAPYHYKRTLRYFQQYVIRRICNPVTRHLVKIGYQYVPSHYRKSFYNGVRNMVNGYICRPLNRKLAAVFHSG